MSLPPLLKNVCASRALKLGPGLQRSRRKATTANVRAPSTTGLMWGLQCTSLEYGEDADTPRLSRRQMGPVALTSETRPLALVLV